MPQWVIKSISNQVICTVKSVEKHGQLMNGRWLTVDIDSAVKLALSAGCYIEFEGIRYSIRSFADVEKSARQLSHGGAFSYKGLRLDDVSWQALEDTQMCDYVYGDNHLHYSGLGTFSFYVTKASDIGFRVLANLRNKYGTGAGVWSVKIDGYSIRGSYTDYTFDEAKSISISSGTSVKEALDLLWSNWGVYYKVGYRTVDIITSDREPGIELKYGKDEGLKSIRRKINPNVEICTRVRAYGSERNMPYKWYNNKYPTVFGNAMYVPQLMLPHYAYVQNGEFIDANGDLYTSGGQVNLWGNPSDIVLPSKSDILTKYGSRDKEIHWNSDDMGEIFPSMKGMTATDVGVDSDTWADDRLDLLLNTAINEDGTAITGTGDTSELTTGKINFKVRVPNPGFDPMAQKGQEDVVLLMQSGMCQSRGFVILKSEAVIENEQIVAYDLTCVKTVDDEIDQVFPNGNYTINGGEEYVYTGLTFNDESSLDSSWLAVYIGAAEKRLLRAAALWLREHQTEQYVYEITPDNIYLQRQKDEDEDFDITEGDFITLSQDDLGHSEEVVETVVVRYGKEAIPTYEISFLRRDESESLGDRVKGLVGQTISVDSDIAKMNDQLYRKVNKTGFHTLFDPLDESYNVLDINGDLSALKYIRANVDFFSTKGVSALGVSAAGGGGGGGDTLNALLDSINDSTIGNTAPAAANLNKCLVWTANGWDWGTTGGSGSLTHTLTWTYGSVSSASGSSFNGSQDKSLVIPKDTGDLTNNAGFLNQSALTTALGSYLPLAGGIMTGQISRSSGAEWYKGRTQAVVKQMNTNSTSYNPVVDILTTGGDWSLGALSNDLYAVYTTNSNFNNDVNQTVRVKFPSTSGTLALTSTTLGGYGITDAKIESGLITLGGNTIRPITTISPDSYSKYNVVTHATYSNGSITLQTKTLAFLLNDANYEWWGQTMNGSTGVVSGDMSNVGNITMSGDIKMANNTKVSMKDNNNRLISLLTVDGGGNFVVGEEVDIYSHNTYIRGLNVIWQTYYSSSRSEKMRLTSDGKLGIGTSSPNDVLDVNGHISLKGRRALSYTPNSDLTLGYSTTTDGHATTNIYGYYAGNNTTTPVKLTSNSYDFGYGMTQGGKFGLYGYQAIGVKGKFMLYYDDSANTVMVVGPDGTSAVNFASLGGISALGVTQGSGGLDELTLGQLKVSGSGVTSGVLFQDGDGVSQIYSSGGILYINCEDTLTISGELDMSAREINNIGQVSTSLLKVGSSGSVVKKIYWDGTYLQVMIGSTTYKFRPDQTS